MDRRAHGALYCLGVWPIAAGPVSIPIGEYAIQLVSSSCGRRMEVATPVRFLGVGGCYVPELATRNALCVPGCAL